AIAGGKKYTSNALKLSVKNQVGVTQQNIVGINPAFPNIYPAPKPANTYSDYILKAGDNVAEKVEKNMHVRLEVNKTSCYVGEPVVAAYKLYTRLKSESRLTQNPSFNGFSVIDLQAADVTATSVEKLNGKDYNVYTIRKAQLYPLQDGKIDLEAAELENNIQFIKEAYANQNAGAFPGIFEEFANVNLPPEAVIDQTVFLKSIPVSIDVKPLPAAGRPAAFKGAVGDFAVESGLEFNSFTAGNSGKLIVMVSGSGNLQLVTPPTITWPAGFEGFDVKTSDILSLTSVPVSGKKIFEYPFTVDKPGKYLFPPVHFDYFDPVIKKYKSLQTRPIPFTVLPAVAGSVKPAAAVTKAINSNHVYLWLIAAVLLALAFILFATRKKIQPILIKPKIPVTKVNEMLRATSLNQQNPLAASEKCLQQDDCFQFYEILMGEIKQFLSNKFHIPLPEINAKQLAEKMDVKNISNETVLQMQQLMQDIEWQLYTPFERDEKMILVYQRTNELLQIINTYDAKLR
ncbi:MAG: BatD family protein, partial [Ferruginibacter sp.]